MTFYNRCGSQWLALHPPQLTHLVLIQDFLDLGDCFRSHQVSRSTGVEWQVKQGVLGIQSVPLSYLCQALQVVGVENAQEILMTRYPELCKEEYVNKVSFVFVLQEEHHRLGYSFKK